MTPPRPKNADEVQLESLHRDVVRGQQADVERKRIMLRLWENGMSQRELAARLSRASLAAGGDEVSENAVFKVLIKYRRRLEAEAS